MGVESQDYGQAHGRLAENHPQFSRIFQPVFIDQVTGGGKH